MIQKCSLLKVLEVFFVEPTTIHFIRRISKEIKLAATSVRNNIKMLLKEKLIVEKKSEPFNGYVANRDSKEFTFLKKAYNFSTLFELKEFIEDSVHPLAIVLFGSYSRGEDVESSDIDILILSKVKKDIDFNNFQKRLKRNINAMIIDNLNKLDDAMRKKINNGVILSGEI